MHGRDAELRDQYVSGVRTEVAIARIRADVAAVHGDLVRRGMVHAAGGTVSGRVPASELFVITPAETPVEDVAPENLLLCDLDGSVIEGTPGSDGVPGPELDAHADLYRTLPAVGGVVSIASPYASAWAARGEEVPCVLVSIAEEFGGPIPVVAASDAGDPETIGRQIAAILGRRRARAVLTPRRGAVAIGASVQDAATVGAFTEEVARIVHVAREGGPVSPLDQDVIDQLFDARRSRVTTSRERVLSGAAYQSSTTTTQHHPKKEQSR